MAESAGVGRRRPVAWGQRVAAGAVWWSGLVVLWLALAGTASWLELLAGGLAAAPVAAATGVLRHQAWQRPRLRRRWLRAAASVPGELVWDTGAVLWASLRAATGGVPEASFRSIPLPHGGDGERDVAVMTWLWSVAPNSVVVSVDQDRDTALVHRLVPPHRRRPGERPVAGP